jgi:hypothetical protein
MNPDIKREWIAALRSGDYPQTTQRLRSGEGYCCLGVLTHLKDPNKWEINERTGNYVWKTPDGFYADTELASSVMNWAGITSLNVKYDDGKVGLAQLNDMGVSFTEIADIIEREL